MTVLSIRSIDTNQQLKMNSDSYNSHNKRRLTSSSSNHEECNDYFLVTRNPVYLPRECVVSIMYHSDSIYVGSRIRIWKRPPDNNS